MQSYILNNYSCVIYYKTKCSLEDMYLISKNFELAYNSFINPIMPIEEAKMGNKLILQPTDSLNTTYDIYLLNLTEELLDNIYLKNIQLSKSEKDFTVTLISMVDIDGMLYVNNTGAYFTIIKNNDKYNIYTNYTDDKYPITYYTLDDILIQLCKELNRYSYFTLEYGNELIYKIKDSVINNKELDILEFYHCDIINYSIKFK